MTGTHDTTADLALNQYTDPGHSIAGTMNGSFISHLDSNSGIGNLGPRVEGSFYFEQIIPGVIIVHRQIPNLHTASGFSVNRQIEAIGVVIDNFEGIDNVELHMIGAPAPPDGTDSEACFTDSAQLST